MDAQPRQKLREIVERYGRPAILDDPRRCRALLLDLCGDYKREIFVLVNALEEQVPHDLLASVDHIPSVVLIAQLTQRLKDNLALADAAARWAVESWAEALDLRKNRAITDAGIEHVRQLTSLKELNLSRTSITDVALGNLYPLKDLTALDLAWCIQVSDEGLARLQGLRTLRSLDLSWCEQITDEGLAHLRTLSNLTALNLWGCKQISNEGLKYLHAIPSLAILDLSHCPQVTNRGVRDLHKLPNLTILYLAGSNTITRGVTLLKRKKPDLYVFR